MRPSIRNKKQKLSTTATVIRTNLRTAREAQGLTRDQAITRIEEPTLTTTALGKIETGDRNITAPELAQLAVAYQIPIQCFFLPWSEQELTHSALSGADFKASKDIIANWFLHNRYPTYSDAITRIGSAIQGAINTRIFTNPKALLMLGTNPSPETYTELALVELENLLLPLKQEVNSYTASMTELCGFDPYPPLQSTSHDALQSDLSTSLTKQLVESITTNPKKKLEKLQKLHDAAANLAASYSYSYGTDCAHSTIEALWDLKEKLDTITKPLHYHFLLTTKIKFAYETNK